jgi:hypothetical protein
MEFFVRETRADRARHRPIIIITSNMRRSCRCVPAASSTTFSGLRGDHVRAIVEALPTQEEGALAEALTASFEVRATPLKKKPRFGAA